MSIDARGNIHGDRGRFAGHVRTDPPADIVLAHTVQLNDGTTVELDPTTFDWRAEEAFTRGHCAAFAHALATDDPDLQIRVLTNYSGTHLLHAWCTYPESGLVIDAVSGPFDAHTEDEFVDELAYTWHTGTDAIETLTPDELGTWLDARGARGTQAWEAAFAMVPAWKRAKLI